MLGALRTLLHTVLRAGRGSARARWMGYTSTGAEKSTWCAARTPTPATRELYPNWQSGNEPPVDSAPAWSAGGWRALPMIRFGTASKDQSAAYLSRK
jgi:hypothetical protein